MLKSRKNRSCGRKVTRPWSSQPSICGNHPHFRTSPRVKKLQTKILGYRSVRFLRRQVCWREEAKTHRHVNFHFFTGRTSFYRASAVLFTMDGESEGNLWRDHPWQKHMTSGADQMMWRVEFVQRPRDTSWSSLESKEERDTHACGQGPPHPTHTLFLTFFLYK